MFHCFQKSLKGIVLPEKFNCPFYYTPHPLCVMAAEEVQAYLCAQSQWADELADGKMFGVLVVQARNGDMGYLAAYSGNLAHENKHSFFVAPIFDLLDPDGFFVMEEKMISMINERLESSLNATDYLTLKERVAKQIGVYNQEIAKAKVAMKQAKANRDKLRRRHPDEQMMAALIRQSQFQRAELKRLEQGFRENIKALQQPLEAYEKELNYWREERAARSFALQKKLFDSYRIVNARGEETGLYTLFEQSVGKLPPAGAGECAAPKLLQYAYKNNLHPLAIAEFWWQPSGNAQKTKIFQNGGNTQNAENAENAEKAGKAENAEMNELRRHGYFYPACKSKCEPILTFMLQGLAVEANPLESPMQDVAVSGFSLMPETEGETVGDVDPVSLAIVYEDEWLVVVNKPIGMLSVPGKGKKPSVFSLMKRRYPEATGPLIVHRLDMDTSGLMVLAKAKEVHKALQKMFVSKEVKKNYIALLDGVLEADKEEGEVRLPLCLDPTDRPRQMVSFAYGKPAITRYRILKRMDKYTLVAFYPFTGRTHQLRVHAAHPDGLNTPILGDRLYGKPAERLYLHAQSLTFTHPVTGKELCLVAQ